MDIVFEKWTKIYGDNICSIQCEKKKLCEYLVFDQELSSNYGQLDITVTTFKENDLFISNGKDKGFLLKKKKLSNSFSYPIIYKNFVNSFGMIQDLIGFSNEYLENLRNIFFEENEEKGICFWLENFLKKSKNRRQFGNLDIDNIKIFAEEANGNLFLLDEKGTVYLYAGDHNYKEIELIEGCPKNTFFRCLGYDTVDTFINLFFEDFCSNLIS